MFVQSSFSSDDLALVRLYTFLSLCLAGSLPQCFEVAFRDLLDEMHPQLLLGRVAMTMTKLEARSAKPSGNKGTNFSVSPADCSESQIFSNPKPRPSRKPIWVQEHGLTLLFEPADLNATVADVVFVHGLQGHPYKTWRYKGKVEKTVYDEVSTFRPFAILSSSYISYSITVDWLRQE